MGLCALLLVVLVVLKGYKTSVSSNVTNYQMFKIITLKWWLR